MCVDWQLSRPTKKKNKANQAGSYSLAHSVCLFLLKAFFFFFDWEKEISLCVFGSSWMIQWQDKSLWFAVSVHSWFRLRWNNKTKKVCLGLQTETCGVFWRHFFISILLFLWNLCDPLQKITSSSSFIVTPKCVAQYNRHVLQQFIWENSNITNRAWNASKFIALQEKSKLYCSSYRSR